MIFLKQAFLVGTGGFLGAIFRYFTSFLIHSYWKSPYPLGTTVVNLTGCFLIGVFSQSVFFNEASYRLFLIIGFLGSLTTFSNFTFESIKLFQDQLTWLGILNILIHVFLGLIFVKLGMTLFSR